MKNECPKLDISVLQHTFDENVWNLFSCMFIFLCGIFMILIKFGYKFMYKSFFHFIKLNHTSRKRFGSMTQRNIRFETY